MADLTHRPAVTVVVPVQDMEETIAACVGALARQDHPSYEVLVVDNGSTDGTREQVRRFPVTLLEESTPGAASARNRGIRAARGEVIAFTDADCVPSRSWLRELTAPMADREITVTAGAMQPLPGEATLIGTYSRLIGQYSAEATLENVRFPYAPTACMAIRKEVLETVGLFDPAFLTYEGADLFHRIHQRGLLRHAITRRALILYRTRADVRAFIRQNFRYGQGYGRFCYRYQEAVGKERLRLSAQLAAWRDRVKVGSRKIAAAEAAVPVRRRLVGLHLARETALLLGILRWRELGPREERKGSG